MSFSIEAIFSSSDLIFRRRRPASLSSGESDRRAGRRADGGRLYGFAGGSRLDHRRRLRQGGKRGLDGGRPVAAARPRRRGLRVVPGHEHRPPSPQIENAGRQPVDERPVVRDEDDRAGKILERLLQLLAGVEVEMIGRLVEEEQVVPLLHHDRERQPPLLAAREARDRREHLVAAKREAGEVRAHRLLGLRRVLVPDRIDRAAGRVEIRELLVVVADRHVVPRRHAAREGGQTAGERLQERRLAGAVLPQDRHALAAQELEGHVAHDRGPGGVAGVQVIRPQERAPAHARGVESERHGGRVLRRPLQPLDPLELCAAPLGLPRVHARDVAPDVLLLLLDELLLLLEGARGRQDALGLLPPVGGVASRIGGQPPVLQVHDFLGHAVQEAPVVGHDEVGAARPREVVLQKLDRVEVEVVGGLVQEEHVRVREDRAGQHGPVLLAARELRQAAGRSRPCRSRVPTAPCRPRRPSRSRPRSRSGGRGRRTCRGPRRNRHPPPWRARAGGASPRSRGGARRLPPRSRGASRRGRSRGPGRRCGSGCHSPSGTRRSPVPPGRGRCAGASSSRRRCGPPGPPSLPGCAARSHPAALPGVRTPFGRDRSDRARRGF